MKRFRCDCCGAFSFSLIKTRFWKNKNEILYLCLVCNNYNEDNIRKQNANCLQFTDSSTEKVGECKDEK
jgi:hypothetical protein